MNKHFKLYFLILIFFSKYTYGSDENFWSHFENGNYEKIILKTKNLDLENTNSNEFNIIGSSFYRLNKKNEAAYYFFLGLKKDPFNSELLHNFQIASNKKIDLYKDKLNQNLFILSNIILFLVFLFLIFRPAVRRKKIAVFFYSILLLITLFIQYESEGLSSYLLIKEEKKLKAGVDPKAFVFDSLKEGEILYVDEIVSGHMKVRGVFNQKVGWIEK